MWSIRSQREVFCLKLSVRNDQAEGMASRIKHYPLILSILSARNGGSARNRMGDRRLQMLFIPHGKIQVDHLLKASRLIRPYGRNIIIISLKCDLRAAGRMGNVDPLAIPTGIGFPTQKTDVKIGKQGDITAFQHDYVKGQGE